MRRFRAGIAVALVAASLPLSAGVGQEAVPAGPPAPPPAYDEELLRLSEILGAIHYLRFLCGHDEKEAWRDEMAALIEAEQPDDLRRARMIDSFNRGYEGFRSVYRTCTPAASESADRYLREGAKVAADITARYGK